MSASPTTTTHVATSHRKPVGHHFCVEARAGDGNSRNSFSGSTFLNKRQILPAFQSVAVANPRGNWIAAYLPRLCDWRRTIERNPNPVALVRRRFLPTSRDISGRGTNFSGGIIQALRSLLTRYPLIPLLQEPTSGRFQTLFLAPAFLSVPVLHESNMQQEQDRDHGKSIHKHG